MWTLTSSINKKHQKQQKIKNKKPKTHTQHRETAVTEAAAKQQVSQTEEEGTGVFIRLPIIR